MHAQSHLVIQWDKMMPPGVMDTPPRAWPMLTYEWPDNDLVWARGMRPHGCRPWHEVDTVSVLKLVVLKYFNVT